MPPLAESVLSSRLCCSREPPSHTHWLGGCSWRPCVATDYKAYCYPHGTRRETEPQSKGDGKARHGSADPKRQPNMAGDFWSSSRSPSASGSSPARRLLFLERGRESREGMCPETPASPPLHKAWNAGPYLPKTIHSFPRSWEQGSKRRWEAVPMLCQ